jgi:hypothetical protein
MRCFLGPLGEVDKKLEELTKKLSWRLTCYQIFFYNRVYESVDKWIYETQCVLDEGSCILTVHMFIRDIDSGPFAHCLTSVTIKYGYDECAEGVYKRSVGYRMQGLECEHSVSCYIRFHDIYYKIFTFIHGYVRCNDELYDVEHDSVTYCVERCEQNYSVLISPCLVYKLLVYFQRLKRAILQMDMLCHCHYFNICKCGLTKQQLSE